MKRSELKKILVTGAAGFIGSHLCEKLLSRGCLVTGIDNMVPNRWIKEKNINGVLRHPNFTFVKADLLQTELTWMLNGVDAVCHLAATPGVRSSWGKKFLPYLHNNIQATQVLLEAAKDSRLKKFILASTSSVYGDADGPLVEEHFPGPISPYGVTKLAAEHLAGVYHQAFGLPLTVLRFFTVYGPRQRPDMAFHRFIRSLLAGSEIKVYGDGNQVRDFTYISDIVEGCIKALDFPEQGHIFNLGGNTRASVNEVIGILAKITGEKAKVSYLPAEPGEPKKTWADISKAADCLNYCPRTVLETGLRKEIAYIEELMNGSRCS